MNTQSFSLFFLGDSTETLMFVKENLLFFAIIFAAIIGKLKEASKQNIFYVWLMYLVGTFFHETSHFLVSLISNGKPSWFSIIPKKVINKENGKKYYALGYVTNNNITWYNSFVISMAPLLLVLLSFLVYKNFFIFVPQNIFTILIYVFLIVALVFSSIPSSVDFANVFKSGNVITKVSAGTLLLYFIYHFTSYNYIENLFILTIGKFQ